MKIEHVEEERGKEEEGGKEGGRRKRRRKEEDESYAKSFGRLRVGNLAFSMAPNEKKMVEKGSKIVVRTAHVRS